MSSHPNAPPGPLGEQIRRRRRRLGLTLDDLAERSGVSKPYLSLIENGRVANPPSDEKVTRLEQALGFKIGELIHQANLQRTPRDVQVMLQHLMRCQNPIHRQAPAEGAAESIPPSNNLDTAYLSGLLQEFAERAGSNIELAKTGSIPVINRVSAGYPADFTDLSYPRGIADQYVDAPDVQDRDAFAARVHGDSMSPKYEQGDIVIFSPAREPRPGDDCFVRFESGHTTFKQIYFEKDDMDRPMVRLQPLNKKYRAQLVAADQISGLYRALYRYQRVDGE